MENFEGWGEKNEKEVNGINHALGGVIIHVAIKYARGGGGGGLINLGGIFNLCIGGGGGE